jgi:hypothetical protein
MKIATTVACLMVGAALAPAAGAATYKMTFSAEMSERWSFEEHSSRECSVGRCVRDETGAGSARIELRTARPVSVDILRGAGQPPMFHTVTEGAKVRGSYRRDGAHVVDYSGGWEAANPDEVADTTGCGAQTLKSTIGFGWTGRNELQVVAALDDLREDCPSGPPQFDWQGDGSVPSLSAVTARASRADVGRAKQFTLRGLAREWRGLVPAVNRTDPDDTFTRFGQVEATWQWTATFRRVRR